MLISFSEFAEIKGCSRGAVTAAVKTDRIGAAVVIENGRKLLDRDLALELWDKNTKPTHNAKVNVPPGAQAATKDEEEEVVIPDLNESRAAREFYMAELARLQVEEQKDQLVHIDKVKRDAFAAARTVRESLLTLADRLAHQVASETDPIKIRKMLEDEHRIALNAICGKLDG